jgi:hypothetical protein
MILGASINWAHARFLAGASTVPFYISYTLLSGAGSRYAGTAAEAMIVHHDLKGIGAGAITIRDETGKAVTTDQLLLLATSSPKRPRDAEPSP